MIRFKKNIRPEASKAARKLIDEYNITDSGGILLVKAFAAAFTTELNCQDKIDEEGLTIIDRFQQCKPHPLLPTLRDSRAQKLAALKALNLDILPANNGLGRPVAGYKGQTLQPYDA
jgi:hypothetical protein